MLLSLVVQLNLVQEIKFQKMKIYLAFMVSKKRIMGQRTVLENISIGAGCTFHSSRMLRGKINYLSGFIIPLRILTMVISDVFAVGFWMSGLNPWGQDKSRRLSTFTLLIFSRPTLTAYCYLSLTSHWLLADKLVEPRRRSIVNVP